MCTDSSDRLGWNGKVGINEDVLSNPSSGESHHCSWRTSAIPSRGPQRKIVRANSNPLDILKDLAGPDSKTKGLIEQCKKLTFRDGIPFLIADEFQFATGSSTANTKVTQMLLSLTYLGIPWCYNANYSLVDRLMKRPEEDRQRLLTDWEILLPDPPESDDWQQTLKSQKDVAPEIFRFDPKEDARAIYSYVAGRKRALRDLMILAFRQEHPRRGVVDIAAIKRAYHSREYGGYRQETEILITQAIVNKPDKNRKDLWCPLPLPPKATEVFAKFASDQRNEKVADEELKASLTEAERKAVQEIQRSIKKTPKSLGEVVPIRKKKVAPTADDLKNNANWFKNLK
jgi:hypothetical protein